MSSSIGSLHEKPILPAELSLDLGSLKARKEKLEQPPPLWKRNQEQILLATNRVSNIPSYVPRFSKVFNQTDIKHIEDATLPTESEIQATLSPREKYYRNLAREKNLNKDIEDVSKNLFFSTECLAPITMKYK